MNEADAQAILRWVSPALPAEQHDSSDAALQTLRNVPLSFLSSHLSILPPHLGRLFSKCTSPAQRGTVARIRERRRRFATHTRPEELSDRYARERDPLGWRDETGRFELDRPDGMVNISVPQTNGVPSMAAPPMAAPPSGQPPVFQRAGPRGPESVAHLLDEAEEEVLLERLQQQEARLAETVAEVDEAEETELPTDDAQDGHPPADALEGEEEFGRTVLVKFIQGDPTLPPQLYDCDFDDRWDHDEPLSSVGVPSSQHHQSARMFTSIRALDDEDAYFDEEEES